MVGHGYWYKSVRQSTVPPNTYSSGVVAFTLPLESILPQNVRISSSVKSEAQHFGSTPVSKGTVIVAGQDLVRDGDAVAVKELTRAEAEAAQKALQP